MNNPNQDFSIENMDDAFEEFRKDYPCFDSTRIIDELREREYSRLDRLNQVYLDYTGGGLYASSQLRQHMELLEEGVFGNPHSKNPTSLAMTHLAEQARSYVLQYFNANPDEYTAIFTPNASGALKLVGEAYPFHPGGRFLPAFDNHNSVNGIREFARAKGAKVTYMPTVLPELRFDDQALNAELDRVQPESFNLFAYPAQSNFTGVQHSLEWIERAHAKGWDVILDAAAFVSTNPLDLGQWKPDFVPLSFYKMFGYPTGMGCLLARKSTLKKLQRPWFAGGTISITSVQGEGWHYLLENEAGFEDGTINFLNLPAVEIGLRYLSKIGIETIHERVECLIAWLLDQMTAIRHSNGTPLVQIYGPTDTKARGGTIAFNLNDPEGVRLDYRKIEALANLENISLRTGCFCNPGTGEIAHDLIREEMSQAFNHAEPMSFDSFYDWARTEHNLYPSAIRISAGIATNFADIYHFINFISKFVDKPEADVESVEAEYPIYNLMRDSA
ncbi:MAG: aminotransferase class V-fold PLP-dependent enzyme [Anaerolineales bacterium]|nr:aminotransferase class V-fold PLP-dependent enzyme [Chloroflexota bacterium]MBL6980570.1 aminotransferase class V-fold PLP-dependent enzyme [Anaerolineales bacterium]